MTDDTKQIEPNKFALAALKDRRAGIASEIIQLKEQIKDRAKQLVHIDFTIGLLDPSIDLASLPVKRRRQKPHLFLPGELGRLVMDVMRKAGRPLTSPEIAAAIMAHGGFSEGAYRAIAARVRSNLAYQENHGRARKIRKQKGARWSLI
jgi:hypothetical protein